MANKLMLDLSKTKPFIGDQEVSMLAGGCKFN